MRVPYPFAVYVPTACPSLHASVIVGDVASPPATVTTGVAKKRHDLMAGR
jgi:hypothetical protein